MSRRLRLLIALLFFACPMALAQSDQPSNGSPGPADGGLSGGTVTLDVATITALIIALLGVSAVGFSLAGYTLRIWVRGHVDPPLTRLAALADRLSEQASPPRLSAFSPARYLGEQAEGMPPALGAPWLSPGGLHLLAVPADERAAVLSRLAADLLADPDLTALISSGAVQDQALGDALSGRGPAAVRAAAGRLFSGPPLPGLDPVAAAWSLSGNSPRLALIIDGWDLGADDAEATPLLRLSQRAAEGAAATGAAVIIVVPPYTGRSLSWAGSLRAVEAHVEGGALRLATPIQPLEDPPLADPPTDIGVLGADSDAVTDLATEDAAAEDRSA